MTIVDDPKAVRSVLIGSEWIHVQDQSFELFDVDGVTWFRFQESRTGYAGHRAWTSGPLSSATAVRSQA